VVHPCSWPRRHLRQDRRERGQNLQKGRQVYVEGCLKTSKYKDKEGVEKTSVELVCNQLTFLGSGSGGEVRDCDDAVVEDAVVNVDRFDSATMSLAYFDADPGDPTPDLSRQTTASDGLFAVINVTTDLGNSFHTLAAGFKDSCNGANCSCTSLGSRSFLAFPDSVSIVSLRGDVPVIR